VPHKVVCINCKKEGDRLWMTKDSCQYHTFVKGHGERLICHFDEKPTKKHKLDKRNLIIENLTPAGIIKQITQPHKLFQYLSYGLLLFFMLYIYSGIIMSII